MAERRMFAQSIILSDSFAKLSKDAQLLYFVIGVVARDKGIVVNAKTMARSYGIEPHLTINELVTNEFLKPLDDGAYQIVHWYENNGIGENQTLKELLFYISLCYSTPGSFLKTSGEVLNNILYKMLN